MPLLVHHQYGRWFKSFFVPAWEIREAGLTQQHR
jgi:nuclear transport factor 2 (NTF2) superfamily protein